MYFIRLSYLHIHIIRKALLRRRVKTVLTNTLCYIAKICNKFYRIYRYPDSSPTITWAIILLQASFIFILEKRSRPEKQYHNIIGIPFKNSFIEGSMQLCTLGIVWSIWSGYCLVGLTYGRATVLDGKCPSGNCLSEICPRGSVRRAIVRSVYCPRTEFTS